MKFFHSPTGPAVRLYFTFEKGKCVGTRMEASSQFEAVIEGDPLKASEMKELSEWLKRYCQGVHDSFPLPLDKDFWRPFQRKVLAELEAIPFGGTASYAAIAKKAGKPKASRAVGQECCRNAFPLIIPCHRVLRSDGSLGGFAFGLALKQTLLNFEEKLASKK